MMKRLLLYIMCAIALAAGVEAQRRITPVTPQTSKAAKADKNEKIDKSRLVEFKDERGNVVLVDTVTGREFIDSTKIEDSKKIIYPLLHEVSFGVNIWDPVMRLLGQKYGGIEFSAELSLYNRFKPIVEIGLGSADATPDDGNYTYKSKMAPYFRLGMNYNFLYKKITDYQFYAGLRYGFSSFSYELNNVTMDPGYWGDVVDFNIPSQNSTVGFGELVFGLKVKIYRNISMGWMMKYHAIIHESKNKHGKPWYIPGYGTRGSSITGGFNITYTIPFKQKAVVAPIEELDIAVEEPVIEEQ